MVMDISIDVDTEALRALHDKLKSRGDTDDAKLIRKAARAVVDMGEQLEKASREVLDLYRSNTRIADALAALTLQREQAPSKIGDLLSKLGVQVHAMTEKEFERVRDAANKPDADEAKSATA